MVLSSHDRAVLDTGFAGTVQAFVPFDLLDTFRERMDAVLGSGACRVLAIRPLGGTELFIAP